MPGASQSRTPSPAMIVAMVLGFGLTGLSAWTYIGPYRWFAALQMAITNGSYDIKLTFLLAFCLIFFPIAGVMRLLGFFSTARGGLAGAFLGADMPIVDKDGNIVAPPPEKKMSRAMGITVVFLTIFAILFGIGGVMWWHGASLGSLTRITAADLEAGKKPESGYLEIEGVALWDYAPSMKEHEIVTYYAPLVSRDWKPPMPVAAYVASSHKLARNPFDKGPPTVKGTRSLENMPGPVKAEFEKGDLKPAPGFILLSLGESPDGYLMGGRIMTLIGAAGTVVFVLVLMMARLRKPVAGSAEVTR